MLVNASRRNEEGAVAIVVAVSAVMLFAVCALAVDLGSGYARKRDIQTQADLAALAAAAELPYSGDVLPFATAAEKYALQNEVMGQEPLAWNFTDDSRANGYIEFDGTDKLRLFAPQSEVDFWLAPVAGLPNEIKVSAVAAAEVRTPGKGLPFFLSTTCSWGEQTILDQTSGKPKSPTPEGSCDSKNSGNFGSLALSRDDVVKANWLEENMALGIQHSIDVYPVTAPEPPDGCAGQEEAVTDSGKPDDDVVLNCLVTDTGSELAQKATDAFITGTAQGSPPRLDGTEHATAPGCSPAEDAAVRSFAAIAGTPTINNDVLSCFLTTEAAAADVTVGDISGETVSGAAMHALSDAIFNSPRFFLVPVLVADPKGGAGSYAVLGMRPVFITEQSDDAEKDEPMATPDNGITMSSNGKQIEKIRVRVINPDALPESAPSDVDGSMPFIGEGTKIIRLVE